MSPAAYRWIGVALALAGATLAAGAAEAAEAQSPDRLAAGLRGTVTFSYPAAANVCGTGDGVLIREPDGSTLFVGRHGTRSGWRWGDPPCETGDARVRLTRDPDGWGGVELKVGTDLDPAGPEARDLGRLDGQSAADLLLAAARVGDASPRDLLLAAAIADGATIWPELLAMARDRSLPSRVRESALHWLGRRAAGEAVAGLGGIVRDRTEDDRIREAAVFALSQLPEDRAIPLLIDVVRTTDDPRVVNGALFWLAGFDDPRAVALFEEILAGR